MLSVCLVFFWEPEDIAVEKNIQIPTIIRWDRQYK